MRNIKLKLLIVISIITILLCKLDAQDSLYTYTIKGDSIVIKETGLYRLGYLTNLDSIWDSKIKKTECDTLSVIMEVCDTTRPFYERHFNYPKSKYCDTIFVDTVYYNYDYRIYWIPGYVIKKIEYYYLRTQEIEEYLDLNKTLLSKNIVVWNYKILK